MSRDLEDLKALLDERNLVDFFEAFGQFHGSVRADPGLMVVTQRLLPAILLEELAHGGLSPEEIVSAYRLIRAGILIVVDNTILAGINERLLSAWAHVHGTEDPAPPKLVLFAEESATPAKAPAAPRPAHAAPGAISMERIVLSCEFAIGFTALSDLVAMKRNLTASPQEREFLRAVRQWPSSHKP